MASRRAAVAALAAAATNGAREANAAALAALSRRLGTSMGGELHYVPEAEANAELLDAARASSGAWPQVAGVKVAGSPRRATVSVVSEVPKIAAGMAGISSGPVVLALSHDPGMVLSRIMARMPPPENWVVTLMDRNGVIAARAPDGARFVGEAVLPAFWSRIIGTEDDGGWTAATSRDGRPIYAAFHKMTSAPWSVAVGVPREVVDGALRRALMPVGIAFAAMLSLTILYAVWASRRVALPLIQLARGAAALGRGEDPITSRKPGIQEFAETEQVWAAMAAAATERRAREADLEALVGIRTAALLHVLNDLREREARFRGIFDSAHQFMALLSADGTIREINQTSIDFAVASEVDLVGRYFWDVQSWAPDAKESGRVRDAILTAAAGQFARIETFALDADGRRHVIDLSVKPVRGGGGEVAFLVAEGRDITEIKAVEAQLAQAQRMDAVGHLTGGVAHDFNNLLLAVQGNLQLLARKLEAGQAEPSALGRHIAAGQAAVERMSRLTGHLLAFARRQPLKPRSIEVNATIAAIARDILGRALGSQVRIETDFGQGLPAVLVDPVQLETAIVNLALNARDAMPGGGVLRVSTRRATLEAPAASQDTPIPGDYVLVAVSDTGCGMEAATLRRAFEPFFTTKPPGHGAGLGLSQVFGFARQSGGGATIESGPGLGTTVFLYLPCPPMEPPDAAL